jgi:hypothetical protein
LLKIGGKGSWLDIGLDVIAVASFGLGRAATGALKDSAVLARATSRGEEFASKVAGLMSSEYWLNGGEEGLEQALPDTWKITNRAYSDLEQDTIREAVGHAPGAWPKWGDILRGFHPVAILRDGFADIGELGLSNWAKLADSETWDGAKFFVGDPELHEAVEGVNKLGDLAKLDNVRGFVANVASNHSMWRFVTVPAVAVDWTNHFLAETGLKEPLLRAVGLGSQA